MPRYRKLKINVICDQDDPGANVPDDEPIFEKPVCEYTVTLRSMFGCPTSWFVSHQGLRVCTLIIGWPGKC